tara:strand:+ start:450 stop:1010 length:561 start_codon:yes stop_codon:yes gene_type:complete
MGKHDECSHTESLSGKLLYCYQMVYCGNSDYLIVKTTDSKEVIYATLLFNGYTFFDDSDIYWEKDQSGNDILVYDIIYSFMNKNDQLALIDAEEILYEELPNGSYYNLIAKKGEVYTEHRLIKYKRDSTQINPQKYEPHGAPTEFNCQMIIAEDIQGELFKKWKRQEKSIIYKTGSEHILECEEWL